MALLLPALTSQLVVAMQQPSDQGAAKAQEWARAYTTYAATAQAAALFPVFVGVEGQALAGHLTRVMTNPNGTAAQFASAFASGIEAFWLLPPVVFTGGGAGAVSLFPGKSALVGLLTSVFSSFTDQTAAKAAEVASALDTATRTVIVAFGPPPTTAPLT